jgi:N-acetylneuraminic acid mutarotase
LVGSNIDESTVTTWLWNGATWTMETPRIAPSSRADPAAATLGGAVVLFGGQGGEGSNGNLNDTWTWSGGIWTELAPPQSPPGRNSAAAATLQGTVVLFGGWASDTDIFGDTWTWDGTSWTEQKPAASPSARQGAVAATLNGRVVLFGGATAAADFASLQNDTWEWDGTTWTKLSPQTSPTPRRYALVATLGDVIVLFGGQAEGANSFDSAYLNDTWTWDGVSWTELAPPASPPATSDGVAGTVKNTLLIAGGLGPSTPAGAWIWNGATWSESEATGPRALDFFASAMSCF